MRVFLPLQAVLLGVRPDLLPVWGDEQFTLNIVRAPVSDLLMTVSFDIHPPLYFALVKLWVGLFGGLGDVVAARLFSVVCTLATTVALDLLWLKGRPLGDRIWFLALWTLSPLLLLYSRMARSYALQMLLAVLVFHAASRAAERLTVKRGSATAVGLALLLYTHYLPGLAVGFAVFVLLARRSLKGALAVLGGAALLYSPWAPTLLEGLNKAATKQVYHLASGSAAEFALRILYWGMAFTFGEAQTWVTLSAAVALSVWLGCLLLAKRPAASDQQRMSLWAAPLGFLGTWRWVAFAFTPARLLFLAPAWLLTLSSLSSARTGRLALAGLLGFSVIADGMYYARVGPLNPGYQIPFGWIADEIERTSNPRDTLVLIDSFNADPSPLLAALDLRFETVVAVDDSFAARVESRIEDRRPETIWYLRSTRDVSPGALNEAEEARLDRDYRVSQTRAFVPYTSLQRSALGLLTSGDVPKAHYQARRYERMSE